MYYIVKRCHTIISVSFKVCVISLADQACSSFSEVVNLEIDFVPIIIS